MHTNNILNMNSSELLHWLNENCSVNIPERVENTEDLKASGELIGKITGYYSFLMSIYLNAKIEVRAAKRNKLPKEEIDEYIDRRDILKEYTDMLKLQYTSISRMITVKKQVDEELKMLSYQ